MQRSGRVGEICGREKERERGPPFFEMRPSSCSAWLPPSKSLWPIDAAPQYSVLKRHAVQLVAWCPNKRSRRIDPVTVTVSVNIAP